MNFFTPSTEGVKKFIEFFYFIKYFNLFYFMLFRATSGITYEEKKEEKEEKMMERLKKN